MPAVTVDYGELDFQWREKTPEPAAPCVPEQTEYATIVFPGRRASADSPQGPWQLPESLNRSQSEGRSDVRGLTLDRQATAAPTEGAP